MYRHPKALAMTYDYIEDVFRFMCLRKKPLFILGDFNENLILKDNKLSKMIKNNKLTQIVDQPTRITATTATLLDLIITNKPNLILSHDVVPETVADHDLISVTLNISKPKRKPVTRTFRHLSNYSGFNFASKLIDRSHELQNIYDTDDVNEQVKVFTNVFNKCLDQCAPTVTKVVRRPPAPWISGDLCNAIEIKNSYQKRLKKDRHNINLQTEYKREKKRVTKLIRIAKSKYYNTQFHECRGNTAATWKLINKIVPNKTHKNMDQLFDNTKEKAKEFNDHFANIGKTTYDKALNTLHGAQGSVLHTHTVTSTNTELFRPKPVDITTVILAIKELNNSNSVGSDDISLKFLKDVLYIITPYITCIINTSIVTGVFPEAWKHAIVVPVFKNGDANNVSNYRPISLLPIVSKILEKIISTQLTRYLEDNDLLSNCQHGFRPRLSTETALSVITDAIYNNMDQRRISLLTLCDLSKAFDSVNHTVLLDKCTKLNIDSFWLESYLTSRTQSVRLNKTISPKSNINYGVPQGSMLGPILFNIFVNDLCDYVKDCILIQYADDTQFLHTGNVNDLGCLITKTEQTLKCIKTYFLSNGLMLNSSKTQCIFIGNRQLLSHIPIETVITIDGNSITPCKDIKNLGVHFDQHMLFNKHIEEISKKVIGTLMFLRRISDNLDKPSRIIAVQSLVLSILNYCILIWGTTNSTQVAKIQKLQNFAAKVANGGAKKYDHVTPILNDLGWLRMTQKHELDICTTTFKILTGFYPTWFKTFSTVRDTIGHNKTRQRNNLYVPKTKTLTGERSLEISGPSLWNKLPPHVTKSATLTTFKKRLLATFKNTHVT